MMDTQASGAAGTVVGSVRRRRRWASIAAVGLAAVLAIAAGPASPDPRLDDGLECRSDDDCRSHACSGFPDGGRYCRAPGSDCAAPDSRGLGADYTASVGGRTWICQDGGRWRSASALANGALCGDDAQCASRRCRANPDGRRYCLARPLDCSDARTNGVAAGYTMQILGKSWTCTRENGWGAARFSEFTDGVGATRECRAPPCVSGDARCEARRDEKLRYCERVKAVEMELAEPVAVAIVQGRDAAERAGVHPIPDRIRAPLEAFFSPHTLDKVRYRVGMPGDSEILRFAFEWLQTSAFVLDYVVVFKREQDALENLRLWAHELEHVVQYEMLGIEGFAQRWILAGQRGGYDDDDRTTIEGAATARAIYVCSHLSC